MAGRKRKSTTAGVSEAAGATAAKKKRLSTTRRRGKGALNSASPAIIDRSERRNSDGTAANGRPGPSRPLIQPDADGDAAIRSRAFRHLEEMLPPNATLDWNNNASELTIRDQTLLPGRDAITISFVGLCSTYVGVVQLGPMVPQEGFGACDTWWGRTAKMRSLLCVQIGELPALVLKAVEPTER